MIKTPDYEALVSDLKAIERDWRAQVAEVEGKQAVIDGAVKVLEQAGCRAIEFEGGDLVYKLWGWAGDVNENTFNNRVYAAFRKHVVHPLRGRDE